jgi:hypothetical protein
MSKQSLKAKLLSVYTDKKQRKVFCFAVKGDEKAMEAYASSFDESAPKPDEDPDAYMYFLRKMPSGTLPIFWGTPALELEAEVNGAEMDLSHLEIRPNADEFWDMYCMKAK